MREEKGLLDMLKTAFLPVIIYYLVHQMTAIFLLGVLDDLGQAKEGNLYSLCARMLAMAIAGAAVYPFYKKEMWLKEQHHKNVMCNVSNADSNMKNLTAGKLSVKEMLIIILAGAAFSLVLNYFFVIIGFTGSSESYNQVAQSQFSYALIPALVFYGVVSPIVEELVFRGIVFSSLKRNISVVPGIIGSALLFGAIHGNIVQMVYGTLMGAVMAVLYEKYDKLQAPILFHGAANVAIYLLTYLFL